jgi:glycosidase
MSRRPRARSLPLLALVCLGCLVPLGSLACSEPPAPAAPDAAAPAAAPPASRWLRDAVGYEIFVRSFADSDGDLRGVTARLDTLRELGVDLLWLTPIHPSPSYHGYDVTDYGAVHPDFGTLADFSQLVEEAHRRGMRVLLDLVLNHTSNQHPWFVAAQRGGSAASRYLFRGDQPGWMWLGKPVWRALGGQPPRSYFGLFSQVMPDLNLRDEDTVRALEDVIGLWLDRGADGYRLDAARYLIEWPDPVTAAADKTPALADTADTHALLRRLRATALGRRADAALLGEVWTDLDTIARYAGSRDELHGCFSFPLAGAILDGLSRATAAPVRDVLDHVSRSSTEPGFFLPFLSNHDQRRVASVVPADALRLGATLLLSMPGTPFLYYGEELGLPQATTAGDRGQRQPMPWDQVAAQQRDPGSLWQHYRCLIELRRGSAALRGPGLLLLAPTGSSGQPEDRLLAFRRGEQPDSAVVAIYNLGTTAISGAVLELPADHPLGPVRDLLEGGVRLPAVSDATRRRYPLPTLPPRSALWLAPAAAAP